MKNINYFTENKKNPLDKYYSIESKIRSNINEESSDNIHSDNGYINDILNNDTISIAYKNKQKGEYYHEKD